MQQLAQPMLKMGTTEDSVAIRRAVIACAIGQVFEIFDFVIYGFFAVAIGRAFFPSTDPIASLLASFATFAVGFLMRPVGAMVIGWYGDRFGRRKALVVTIGMMAAATGITGLIPSYAMIGLIEFRLGRFQAAHDAYRAAAAAAPGVAEYPVKAMLAAARADALARDQPLHSQRRT